MDSNLNMNLLTSKYNLWPIKFVIFGTAALCLMLLLLLFIHNVLDLLITVWSLSTFHDDTSLKLFLLIMIMLCFNFLLSYIGVYHFSNYWMLNVLYPRIVTRSYNYLCSYYTNEDASIQYSIPWFGSFCAISVFHFSISTFSNWPSCKVKPMASMIDLSTPYRLVLP